MNRKSLQVTGPHLRLFCIVGMALWGFRFITNFMVSSLAGRRDSDSAMR